MSNLMPLKVQTTCNTSDTDILANLRATKERGLPYLEEVSEPKERALVIVGSGPSAKKALAEFDLTKVDVMALNGAYNYLMSIGFAPDYFVMLDARAENVNFLERAHEHTHYYLAAQVHPQVYGALWDKKVTTFHLNTETTRTVFEDKEGAYFGGSGGVVGSTAISLAGVLGYRDIWLLGYDSSFSEDKSHLIFQPQNASQIILDVEFDGKWYKTTPSLAEQVTGFLQWSNLLHVTFEGLSLRLMGEGLFYDYMAAAGTARPKPTREQEAEKYGEMYKLSEYAMPAHRKQAVQDILASTNARTLLDVGTGRGETLGVARNLGYEKVAGTETVDGLLNEHVVKAYLPHLPFEDRAWGLVTCFEVLEHLLPEDVVPAIAEIMRVSSGLAYVSACTMPDYWAGVNLHPSARSEAEWIASFKEAGVREVTIVGNFSINGVSPVFKLIK